MDKRKSTQSSETENEIALSLLLVSEATASLTPSYLSQIDNNLDFAQYTYIIINKGLN